MLDTTVRDRLKYRLLLRHQLLREVDSIGWDQATGLNTISLVTTVMGMGKDLHVTMVPVEGELIIPMVLLETHQDLMEMVAAAALVEGTVEIITTMLLEEITSRRRSQ